MLIKLWNKVFDSQYLKKKNKVDEDGLNTDG